MTLPILMSLTDQEKLMASEKLCDKDFELWTFLQEQENKNMWVVIIVATPNPYVRAEISPYNFYRLYEHTGPGVEYRYVNMRQEDLIPKNGCFNRQNIFNYIDGFVKGIKYEKQFQNRANPRLRH